MFKTFNLFRSALINT